MSPRTNSPPPSYGPYDDFDCTNYHPGTSFRPTTTSGQSSSYSNNQQQQFYSTQNSRSTMSEQSEQYSYSSHQYYSTQSSVLPPQRDFTAATTNNRNKDNPKWFSSILFRPLNIPRRMLSSTAAQAATFVMIYSLCITIVLIILCTSYVLTFYDDARRVLRTSRVWAQIKSGVRERISMLGGDWEEFLQKYFDQPWDGVNVNRNGHLGTGGFYSTKNSNSTSENKDDNKNSNDSREKEWEDWLKNTMFKFMTVVAGQEISNRFQQSATSFQSQFWTTTNGDGERK